MIQISAEFKNIVQQDLAGTHFPKSCSRHCHLTEPVSQRRQPAEMARYAYS